MNNADFALHKTLNADNWRALRRLGAETNARFLAAIGEGQGGLPDPATLESVVLPSVHDGQRAPGLRFGDPVPWLCSPPSPPSSISSAASPTKPCVRRMAVLWRPGHSSALSRVLDHPPRPLTAAGRTYERKLNLLLRGAHLVA